MGGPFPMRFSHAQSDPAGDPRVANTMFTLHTVWRARPVRLILYSGFILVVAIATAGWLAISNLRNNALADSERELQNVAAVLAEHVERAFEALTLTQLGFAQEVQALNVVSEQDFGRRVSGRG